MFTQKRFSQIPLYLFFIISALLLNQVGDNGEPLALALLFACLSAGLHPFFFGSCYFFISLFFSNFSIALLALFQALVLSLAFWLKGKFYSPSIRPKQSVFFGFLPPFFLFLSLAGFVLFSPFTPYALAFVFLSFDNAIFQKIIIAAFIFLLSACFSVSVKAILKKILKCRLRTDELIFSLLLFVFLGVGACRLLGVNAYMGIAFFILLLFSHLTKDASCLLCAFVLSLPPYLVIEQTIERFFLYGVAFLLFSKSGRPVLSTAFLSVFFLFAYADGVFALPTHYLVQSILSAVLPALLFILLPTPFLQALESKLIYYKEKHLSRVAINRNRAAIGEQLYEISAVFRDIQATFSSLGSTQAEENAKAYLQSCVIQDACKKCEHYKTCKRSGAQGDIEKLITIGCMKGKANLMDIPKSLAGVCVRQNDLLYFINRQLGEYQKYTLEMENAANGRALLAGQAQGVSEILKNLAFEQSQPIRIYADKERTLNIALLKAGIVSSELLLYGEENDFTLSLVTFERVDVKKIAKIASHTLGVSMMISKRIYLSGDRFCCILKKRPLYDAAFGIASKTKTGESASGDTHSVLKIDEHRFLVALSDGMGSGEYAKRISESTVTLLESFYRAKMPKKSVLSTVNKLLTFHKEESFACVDVAIVDLNDGQADIVKIGSPVGFILSGSSVKVLESSSLPLGILDTVHPDTATHTLHENDVLLFLSDGITGAFGSTSDLYELLKTVPIQNPQELADSLLETALQAYGGVAKDDMTAVAVRIYKSMEME